MLQQIIEDMYIDPDLLAELSEDQKQLIFLKIREEQIRRYNGWKDKANKEEKDVKNNKKTVGRLKTVQWLLGSDGKPWTWVMGEHKDDKSIEQIIEEEQRKEARKTAEFEAEKMRLKEEEEMKLKIAEEQKKLEEERKKKEEELAKIKAAAEAERKAAESQRLAKEKADTELRISEKKKQEEERAAKLAQETEQTKRKLDSLKETTEKARLKREESYRQLRQQRESEILSAFHKTRAMFERNSVAESVKIESAWKLSEEKAKQADKEKRSLVQSAREDYKRNLKSVNRRSASNYNTSNSNNNTGVPTRSKNFANEKERKTFRESAVLLSQWSNNDNDEAVNEAARVLRRQPSFHKARPKTKAQVEDWFLNDQKPRKVGLKPNGAVEPWFHGIISREDAEGLLQSKPVHSYLVRVSEKIFGYAISYKSAERIKHYLVDIEEENYQFFGTNQLEHKTLQDLVSYHKDQPVSSAGQELLMFPVGQCHTPPDYTDLYPELVESTSL